MKTMALGRQEEWEVSPEGYPQTPPYQWWNYHDAYGRTSDRSRRGHDHIGQPTIPAENCSIAMRGRIRRRIVPAQNACRTMSPPNTLPMAPKIIA